MPEIRTADSVCLSLLVFTQLFSEIARCQPTKPARKQNLAQIAMQSGSFMVIYFGVTGKATGDFHSRLKTFLFHKYYPVSF